MAAPVPREEINLPAVHLAADDRIGGIAKRRFDACSVGFSTPSIW